MKISPHIWCNICNRSAWGLHLLCARKVMFTACTSLQRNILYSSNSNYTSWADKSWCKNTSFLLEYFEEMNKTRYASLHEFPLKMLNFCIISFVLYRNRHLVVTLLNKWNTNYKWHLYDHNRSFLAARNIFFRVEPAFLQMAWKKKKKRSLQNTPLFLWGRQFVSWSSQVLTSCNRSANGKWAGV